MSLKITPHHLARAAVVYIRQSTLAQVLGNLKSQRQRYALVAAAQAARLRGGDHHRRRSWGLRIRTGRPPWLPEARRHRVREPRRGRLLPGGLAARPQRPRLASPDRLVRPGRRTGHRSRRRLRSASHQQPFAARSQGHDARIRAQPDASARIGRAMARPPAASSASPCRPATAGGTPDGSRSTRTSTSPRRSNWSCASSAT